MKSYSILALAAVLSAALPLAAPAASAEETAAAQSELTLRSGLVVYSADDRRIGKISSLVGDRDAPTAVKVIFRGKIVVIPADTLSAGDRPTRVQTSLTYDEIG